jgi:hypothetical protein
MKKLILTETERKAILAEKEIIIIESFKKNFNKIDKRNNDYYETLSEALDSVRDMVNTLGYELNEDELFTHFGTGGIPYETTKSATVSLLKNGEPILDKRGKELNRNIRISIYRMPSGRYELTAYSTF